MSEQQQGFPHQHLKSAYQFISLILFSPILLWPVPILLFQNPMLDDVILPKWHLSIIIMLIACIAMDTILTGVKNFHQSINATLWLIVPSILIMQNQQYTWLLAMLFLAHSLRSATHLFKNNTRQQWWLPIAWFRDISASTVILLWLYIL
ncbi:MAG TPA: hypothetical protein EYP39_02335 [Ghiorsea sp.]|nr:hypothetical protein [Ghiorsea sp.]